MGDRVTIGAGDTATLFETINDDSGGLVKADVSALKLTVWRCGTAEPVIDAASGVADADNPAGGVDVHGSLAGLTTRGLYLARWRATIAGIPAQTLSFPSHSYTLIEVT